MKDLFIVAWIPADEAPSYEVTQTDTTAWAQAHTWEAMSAEGDLIDVLRLNGDDLTIERLGSP